MTHSKYSWLGTALGAVLLVVGLGLSSPAHATSDAMRSVQLLIMQNILAGNYKAAIAAAEDFEPDHPNHAARVAYVKGLVARAKGNNIEAIVSFRAALAEQPDQIQVRQALAQSLFDIGDYDAAKYNFDIVAADTNDARQRLLIANYRAAMEKNKPWSLSGYFSFAPSSNLNRGSNHETALLLGVPAQIDPKQQKHSGLGIATGFSGAYNFDLGTNVFLSAGGGVDGRFYLDHDTDVLRLNASLKPGFVSEDQTFRATFGPYVSTTFDGYDHVLTQFGLDGDFAVKLDQSLIFSGSTAALYQDFKNDDLEGYRLDGNVRLIKFLPDSVTLSAFAGLAFEETKNENFQHRDWRAGLNASKEWEGGWMTGVDANVGRHIYEGAIIGKVENRKDWTTSAGVQLSNRKFSAYGLMPILNYSYTRQNSNDEWADYDSHDVSMTLTRAF